MARVTGDSVPDGELGQGASGILGRPLRRRAFLQVASVSALGVLGARAGLAGVRPATGPAERPAALAPDPIGELAASLEYDVDRIFRFVTDEIRYEPYPGILRGPTGTLLGRAGNSVDQALLLAALLEASLVPVRFVRGALDDAQADVLLAGAVVDEATARADAERILSGSVGPEQSTEPELPEPDPELRQILDRLPEIARTAREVAGRQLEAGIGTVVDALADAGIDLPLTTSAVPALEREQHVWLQIAATAEWIDLDPTAPGARPGATLTEPVGEPLDALPDELRHRVAFEVIAERLTDGALTQESVLEHAAFVDELASLPIVLLHERPQALEALGVGLAGVLTGTSVYQPILQVGDRALIGLSSLSFGGDGGALGALVEDDDLFAAGGESTAEWLEVHVTPPLGDRSTTRRTLFDRVGDSLRASERVDASLIEPAELVDLDETMRSEYVPLRTLHVLGVAGGPSTGDLLREAANDDSGVAIVERTAHYFHLARDAMAADLTLESGARAFLDGPNVTAFSIATAAPGSGTPAISASLDILTRSFGHLPLVAGQVVTPPGVVAGVLAHVAERIALGDSLPTDIVGDAREVSVGAIFEAADAQGVGTLVLRDRVPDGLPFSAEALERLGRAMREGWVAIVPERPVRIGSGERLGWWLVEPATGRTVDMLEDGRGAGFFEYIGNLARATWRTLRPIAKFGLCLRHILTRIALVFALATGDSVGLSYALISTILGHKAGQWGCRC